MKKTFEFILLVNIIILILVFTGCKKEIIIPELSTSSVINSTDTTITTGGDINSDGGAAITARGVCWGIAANPTTDNSKTTNGSGTGIFTSVIKGFMLGTPYHVRAYATNSVGTAYGEDVLFITNITVPKLTTVEISSITSFAASSGGNIIIDGGTAIMARGVCWNTTGIPTIVDSKTTDGNSSDNFVSHISGLEGYKTYYVRAYATNSVATGYGNQIRFVSQSNEIVFDNEENIYNTVKIGSQVWMAENLRTIHYNNGDPIPNVSSNNSSIYDIKTGLYNWYNDDVKYKNPYGALYNWYAITDSRKLCPAGWHVPTSTDWNTLITFLGGKDVAGGKMKEDGSDHWVSPNNADNSSGFNALPGGAGGHSGSGTPMVWYDNFGIGTVFGSSSRDNVGAPYIIWLDGSTKVSPSNAWENMTQSIRCIKDE